MADTFGLGSLFQEEGPGRSGGPRLLPEIGLFGETKATLADRLAGVPLGSPEQVFGASRRPDGRVVQFGLPEEFSQEEILRALEDIKSVPASSTLADRKAVADVAKRLEALPEDDPTFAEGPLDALSADINNTLSELKTSPSQTQKTATTAIANLSQQFAEDEMGRGTSQATIEDAFIAGMDDFLETVRGAKPDTKTKDLEKYKKEFADATGIDISGKVDKSHALMTFGLALMQNKAGKGFNVGKMLSAVGKAGETALPALEKAREKARAGAAAAGKYALTARAADQATDAANLEKSLAREQYYVYERGPDGAPFAKLDKGDLFHLSKYELSELMKDPKFDKNYSFLTAKDYLGLQSTGTDTDLGNPYGKSTKISLLGGDLEGVPSIYIVDGQRPDGNYKGNKKEKSFLQSDEKSIVKNIINEQQSILKEQDEFSGLIANIQSGVSIPKQIGSSIIQFGRNLGLDLGTGPTQIAQARKKLEKIQLLNATEILQESGKTLSDQDRERVKAFVGQINLANADDALILQSLGRVYDIVLQARQRNLDTAVSNLDSMFGITFETYKDAPPTKKELDAMNKERGTNFTMKDFIKSGSQP